MRRTKYLPGARAQELTEATLDRVAEMAVAQYERDRAAGKTQTNPNPNPFAPGSIQFHAYQSRLMGHTR